MRRRTLAKREAILDAALAVVSTRGFADASLSEISAHLGGSKQTIYNYFSSKEALFQTLVRERAQAHLGPILATLAEAADFKDGLGHMARAYLSFITLPDALSFRRLIVADGSKNGLGCLFFEAGPAVFLEHLAVLLKARMTSRELLDADPAQAALHLVAPIEAGPYQRLLTGVIHHIEPQHFDLHVASATAAFGRAYRPEFATDNPR